VELGEADDCIFGRSNSKQINGAVGILTADAVDREELYAHAVLLALIPFLNPTLY
jgi:non-canonical (house-cleaning) NTP pyrophosphatase